MKSWTRQRREDADWLQERLRKEKRAETQQGSCVGEEMRMGHTETRSSRHWASSSTETELVAHVK